MNKSILVAALLSVSFGVQAMQKNEVAGKESTTCKPVTHVSFDQTWDNTHAGFTLTRNDIAIAAGLIGTVAHLIVNSKVLYKSKL